MANAAIAWFNYVDSVGITLSASGSVLLAPPTVLRNPHVGKKWRDNAASTWIAIDMGASFSISTIMLAGVSGGNPLFRVRLSNVSTSGVELHDSGTISGVPYFDSDYGMFVYLLSTPITARYVRVDISEVGVSYIEAGRWFVGPRDQFTINMQTPWTRTPIRGSVDVIGVGGQTYVDLRSGYWQTHASFEFLTEAEAYGFVEDISNAIINTGHRDLLWIKDPSSTNLSRDCIWGYPSENLEISQNIYIIPALYKVDVTVRQRL
jgi:hypothetical protein